METGEKLDLIHIDQHSDLREPNYYPAKLDSIEEIIQYTFKGVNVGSYLLPAKKYFVNEIYQVRTQFALRNLDKDLQIISLANDINEERKLKLAGATSTINPYETTGLKIFRQIHRPISLKILEKIDEKMQNLRRGKSRDR